MIQIALSQYGIKETPGEADNPEVLKYFDEIGFNGSQLKDETAWCSAFMNWVAKKSGRKYSGKLNAKSWLEIGTQTAIPQIGDVVVLQRGPIGSWKGHVGLCLNQTKFIHAYGPKKKVIIMPTNFTIKIIKKTAKLKIKKISNIKNY